MLDRADLVWLGIALSVGIGVRLAWILHLNVNPNDGRLDDSAFYHNVAHLLSMGAGYTNPWIGGPTAQWPPAFPAALALFYKWFGWHLAAAKALNLIFAGLTILFTYLVAKRVFDRGVAFLSAMVLALFPGQIYFSTLVLAETMFGMAFLLVVLLALVWTLRPDASWWQPLLVGVAIGGAAMVRAEGVFLVCILPIVWAVVVRPWRAVPKYTALLALGLVLGLAPWTIRNALVFDEFIPLRPDTTLALSDALDPQTAGPGATADEDRRTIGESLRHFGARPLEFVPFMARKLPLFFNDDADGIRWTLMEPRQGVDAPHYKLLLTKSEAERWMRLADGYFFLVGALAFVGGIACLLQRNRESVLMFGAVIGWSLLFAFLNPVPRYHFPLAPLFSILAATSLVLLWRTVAARRPITAGPSGAQAVVSRAERPAS